MFDSLVAVPLTLCSSHDAVSAHMCAFMQKNRWSPFLV
jgi:hypothetical protein